MGEKKGSSMNVALALAALSAVLIVALGFTVASYMLALRDKDMLIDSLRAEVVALGGDPGQVEVVGDKDAQIASLLDVLAAKNGEILELTEPKIVGVDLKAEDNRDSLVRPYVHVYGYVVNVGNSTAENVRIRVVLQRSGGFVVEDTFLDLGSLGGELSLRVDKRVYYEGSEVDSASMTFEWS